MEKSFIVDSLRKLRKLSSPQPCVFNMSPLREAKMPGTLTNLLRVFEPINTEKGRCPISQYGTGFDKFKDALSDSPITIGAKLGKDWRQYNNHIIVQSAFCNFRCHYCYVDYRFLGKEVVAASADTILEEFLLEREKAAKLGKHYNVLRISGGEPMLVPDLTLACLRKIKKMGLDSEIFIKTETNLSPLMKINNTPLAAEWADFDEFHGYKNFIMHPTVHGISAENIKENCAVCPEMFEMVCEGLDSLVNYHIDFYPSFGANTVRLRDVEEFFNKVRKIHKNLPLRFAVRPFNLKYDVVTKRTTRGCALSAIEHKKVVEKWDMLLQENYGVHYAEVPRWKVSLD